MATYLGYTVPATTDTPDVPRDFQNFTDSVVANSYKTTNGVWNWDFTPQNVATPATVNTISVAHTFPAGSILFVEASAIIGCFTTGGVNHTMFITQNGVPISVALHILGTPNGWRYTLPAIFPSTGPSTIGLSFTAAVDTIQVWSKELFVHALLR